VNYDSGAIPAVLEIIKKELDVSDGTMGVIGMVPYVGITIAAPLTGYAMQKYSQKTMLLYALMLNTVCTLALALAYNWVLVMIARFCIGLSQGPFVVYSAVWAEEFAPFSSKTLYVALLQLGVPVGVMIGYSVSGEECLKV
jgi:predicted MFS family arabinose efflux permease